MTVSIPAGLPRRGQTPSRHSRTAAAIIAAGAGKKKMQDKPVCAAWPIIPVTSTIAASGAAIRAAGEGANAADSASGAGATVSSSPGHHAGTGSALSRAATVIAEPR